MFQTAHFGLSYFGLSHFGRVTVAPPGGDTGAVLDRTRWQDTSQPFSSFTR